jgi:putative tricarboxylic transport membrane protein
MFKTPRSFLIAAGALAGIGAIALPALAQSGAGFFKNKTVTYIVATSPGGGYDFYGRLVSNYMEKYLPGSTFVVKNLPGAGHIVGTNTIYASRPDGLTIGTFNTGLIYNQLIGLKAIKFDLTKMSWIGKAAADPRIVVVSADSGIKSWQDLINLKTPVNFSTAGIGSAAYVETTMLQKLLNIPIKIQTGYNGSDDQLAMRRGEIIGTIASRSSWQQFVDNGYARFIAQIGGSDKDVPQLSTLVSDPDAKAFIALVQSQGDLSRLTAGPAGIPADRLAALRDAYRKSMEDPKLQADIKKAGRPLEPLVGEEVAKRIEAALTQPPKTIALLKETMSQKAPTVGVEGTISSLADRNKKFVLKTGSGTVSGEISGSRTKITIKGAAAKRGDLKVGMTCTVVSDKGATEAKTVACK